VRREETLLAARDDKVVARNAKNQAENLKD
jgi:hypothetical protein